MALYEVGSDGTLTKKAGGIGLRYDSVSTSLQSVNAILDTIYPIGSIRLSINPNETNFLGGTWVIVSQGRALFGAGPSSETPNGETYTTNTTKNAGLPNITGNIFVGWNDASGGGVIFGPSNTSTSALYHSRRSGQAFFSAGSSHGADGDLEFDASRANAIYGNSNTVQPNAYICYIYKRTA